MRSVTEVYTSLSKEVGQGEDIQLARHQADSEKIGGPLETYFGEDKIKYFVGLSLEMSRLRWLWSLS
jgi:hypothetical protein